MAGRTQLPGIAEAQAHRDDWRMSPGVISNRLMFLTGMTGNRNDGSITSDPEEQIRDAFAKVAGVFGSAAGSPRMVC